MINKLEKEISDLEKLLEKKKDKLLALKNEEKFSNKNQLIAIVEMHDQFYQIADIQLVENNIKSIQKLEESYKNILYCHEFKFFNVKDLEEEYTYLQKMMNLQNIGEDAIQDWMTEHSVDAVNS